MAESSMATPEVAGKRTHVWGAKVGSSNYKSVTIDDEVYALGDCVRRPLDNKPEHVGKIVRLFEKDGKGMCRLRSFYTPSEVTESAKGLENSFKPKEVFLASGEGPGVEIDSILEKVEGKCIILCTAEESFNEMPSPEQLEAADYFFSRAYDPAGEEVVGLDTVEEAIGAQKVYNKKEWLAPADRTLSRSTSQVSAGKVQRQSPAVSGSSSHQGGAKAIPSTVSPAPSSGSLKEKSEVPEPSKDDAVESKKKLPVLTTTSAMKSEVPEPSKDDAVESKKKLPLKGETSAMKSEVPEPSKDDAVESKKKLPLKGETSAMKSEVPEPSKDDAVESKKKLPLKGETSAMKSEVPEPSKDDAAQTKKDDAAQSKKDDAAQSKKDDAAQSKKDDAAQSTKDDAAQSKKDDAAQSKKDDAAQSKKDDAAQSKKDDAAQSKKDDAAHSKKDDAVQSKKDDAKKDDVVQSKKKVPVLKGETSATSIQTPAHPQHITFGIPAPSRVLPSGETKKALPVNKQGKPPISKPKAVTPGGKGVPVKVPSPAVGLKKKVLTKDGAVMKKRKLGDTEDGAAVSGEKREKLQHVPNTEVGAATFEKKKQLSTDVGAAATNHNKSKLETKLGAVSGEKKSATVTKPSTEVGATTAEKKRQQESEPVIERAQKKVVKPMERSNLSSERESPSEFPKFDDRSLAIVNAPAPEQKQYGQIFKPRIEDWEVANLIPAINSNRVLLLENLDAELHSDDLAEALTVELKVKCDVRIAPLLSPHFRTTSALLKLPSRILAQQVLDMMNSSNVIIRSRLVSATVFRYSDFKAPVSKPFGHIEFAKEGRDYMNEDYRDALATSHFAQGNTIEFDYGLPWKVLAEQHDEQWKLLQKHVQDTNPSLKI